MKQEVKTKWLEALKSGNYTQGYGYLISADSIGTRHCCLGVLCDISGLVEVDDSPSLSNLDYTGTFGMTGYLPSEVRDWAGITIDEERTLAGINDSKDCYDKSRQGSGFNPPNGYKHVIEKIEEL